MAVPAQNGVEEDDSVMFFEEGITDGEIDGPAYLRDIAVAAMSKDVSAFTRAINLLSDINEPVEDGDTALHLACLYGSYQCVEILLDRGANLEVKDEDGALPLHDACAGGFLNIINLLKNRARDDEFIQRMLSTTDSEGDTPLHHAARGGHVDVVKELLASGAFPTQPNTYGKVPLELAEQGTDAWAVLAAATRPDSTHGDF